MKYKFKSDLLNEQVKERNLKICEVSEYTKVFYKSLVGIQGDCVMVEMFPHPEGKDYYYSRKLKDKMYYHLKKEGFKFSSYTGMVGYYIKEI
jgi:hypothetical protein